MNERIKELAEQAGCAWWEGRAQRDMTQCQTELGKFAELMVKKFDDILLLQYLDCIGNHDKKSAELIEQIRTKTKTYFGVE